ncbi:MAG: hypothetical protein ACREKB_19320, partial [Candidatus Rokuibacteriota bacterium]
LCSGDASTAVVSGRDAITEAMTVGETLRRFPETQPVFEQLFVRLSLEAYDCLDEVAWRHGVPGEALRAQLNAAIDAARSVAGRLGGIQDV